MNFGVDKVSNIINNIDKLEKEAVVGLGLAVEPLDKDEKYNLTIGFPQVVGVSRNFGTSTIRPIVGAGFPVPIMPGIGYFPEQRRIHLTDEQLEKVKSNRKLLKEYNRLNRLRRSPSEDEIRNLIERSITDKQLEKKAGEMSLKEYTSLRKDLEKERVANRKENKNTLKAEIASFHIEHGRLPTQVELDLLKHDANDRLRNHQVDYSMKRDLIDEAAVASDPEFFNNNLYKLTAQKGAILGGTFVPAAVLFNHDVVNRKPLNKAFGKAQLLGTLGGAAYGGALGAAAGKLVGDARDLDIIRRLEEKKAANDEMSNLIEKLTAETIKEYIEKEAIAPAIAAAGRSAMPKLKQMFTSARNSLGTLAKKPEVTKGMATGTSNQANTVADWGSEISKSWSQSRKLGANVLGSAGNAWRAGWAANPTLSTGVVAGTGALAVGGVTGAVSGKRRKNNQPNITINAAVIESDLDKQALFENSDPLDMLMKGVISGAAIGTSIALGGKLKGVQARNQVYAADTKNIRGMFDNLKPFTAEANTFVANRNADLIKQIPDKRLRDIFISTLEDGGKLVENLKKTLPKQKLPELQKQLQDELNRNRATLPMGVQTRLQKMIDSILEEGVRRV